MRRHPVAIAVLAAAFALFHTSLTAQTTAEISGRVTDATGAAVPGVDITLTRVDTAATRSAVTNDTGAYSFPSLNPGPYRLQASLQGFRTFVQPGAIWIRARLLLESRP